MVEFLFNNCLLGFLYIVSEKKATSNPIEYPRVNEETKFCDGIRVSVT